MLQQKYLLRSIAYNLVFFSFFTLSRIARAGEWVFDFEDSKQAEITGKQLTEAGKFKKVPTQKFQLLRKPLILSLAKRIGLITQLRPKYV